MKDNLPDKIPEHLIAKPLSEEQCNYYKNRQRPKGEGYLVVGILAIVLFPFLWLYCKVTGQK